MLHDVDGHVRESLGLYLMGALLEEQCLEIEAHLDHCEPCRREARELREVTFALALISAEEAEILTAPAVNDGWRRGKRTFMPSRTSRSRPASGARPARERPISARAERRRLTLRSAMAHARMFAAAALVALVLGFTAGLVLKSADAGAPTATAAAFGDDQATGASLSVSALGGDDKVSVGATVDGLTPGQTYRLFLVTSDGKAHLVQQWVNSDGPHTVAPTEIGVPISTLAYFTVVDAGGQPVMLAWVKPRPTASR